MGSQIEKIFDQNENNEDNGDIDENTINNNSYNDNNNNNNELSEQFNDFEFIEFYESEGSQNDFKWSAAKVRSLKSKKIYAMKNIQNPQFNINFYTEQINVLKKLNHQYVIKYYKLLNNGSDYYLIMEYMNNCAIKNFIDTNKLYEYDIEEEILLKILLQCSSALVYLHKNQFPYWIKLTNIFMDNDRNIKIGLFNEKNNINFNYNPKDDILYLGNIFHTICFEKEKCPKKIYSKDLINIINSLREIDINKRWDSERLLENVKEIYFKTYMKNTSITSILRCLYAYPDLNDKIFRKKDTIKNNRDKYYLQYKYIKITSIIAGFEEGELNEKINEFRFDISLKYSKFKGHQEINPFYFFIFLLENMYKESNNENETFIQKNNQEGQEIIDSVFNVDEIDKLSKKQMLKKFTNNYNNNVNSYIADLFSGIVLTEIKCDLCENIKYSFSNFCFLYYDISKRNDEDNFDLWKDGIDKDKLPRSEKLYCEKCLIYQNHFECNKYYKMPPHLVIYFNRGNKYNNNSNIVFEENLYLTNYIGEDNESVKQYNLVGSINRRKKSEKEEEFIYYARDQSNTNIWYISNINEPKDYKNAPIKEIQSDGQIIMLFYNENKGKNI